MDPSITVKINNIL